MKGPPGPSPGRDRGRTPRGGARGRFPPVFVPAALSLLAFADTVPGDFVFDDAVVIESNQAIRRFDLGRIFSENYWGTSRRSPNYRPLTILSYALNYRISGKPWAFHAVNVILHALATGAFYLVSREVLASPWAAAASASLFAVLPIHTEAVANTVGRAELLAACAIFLAWWISLRRGGWGRPWTALAIGAVVLAGMLCKENTAVVAALIPLSACLLRRRIPWLSTSAALAGILLFAILWKLLPAERSTGPLASSLVDNGLFSTDPLTRVLNAAGLLGLYAFRTVLPLRLSADHSFDQIPVTAAGDPVLWLEAACVVLGIAIPIALTWRRSPAVAIGFAAFPIAFALSCNIFVPIGTIFAERLAYAPSSGYALALAAALAAFSGSSPKRRKACVGVLSVLIAVYGVRSLARNLVWADAATFDVRLAEDAPRSTRAHLKAAEGCVLLSRRAKTPEERKGLLERAESELQESLRIYPDNAGALGFRAEVLVESFRWQEALRSVDEAEAALRRTRIEKDPELDYLRAEILLNLKRFAEAREALDRYLARRGPVPKALNLRGACRMSLGDSGGAREDFDGAIALDPLLPTAFLNRGILFAQIGNGEGAARDFDAAAAIDPENPQVHANRGYFRFTRQDPAGAVRDYREGIEVCLKKGLLAQPAGESALAFRRRIFDVLIRSGDREAALRELEAIQAMPSPLAQEAARELEAMLPK